MTTASSSTANPLNAGDGEMGAALYVPDVQRMVRLTLQPCGGCGGKAYAVEAALSRPVREVRGQLAALLLGGEGTASPSWWARLTAQTGAASQEKAPLASDVHLFLADGGEAATYTALPDDTLLQDLLTDGESRDELTLHYTAEKKFGDGDDLLCLACCAACACCTACCCAAAAANSAAASNKPPQPPKPPANSTNNNYYYQNGQPNAGYYGNSGANAGNANYGNNGANAGNYNSGNNGYPYASGGNGPSQGYYYYGNNQQQQTSNQPVYYGGGNNANQPAAAPPNSYGVPPANPTGGQQQIYYSPYGSTQPL